MSKDVLKCYNAARYIGDIPLKSNNIQVLYFMDEPRYNIRYKLFNDPLRYVPSDSITFRYNSLDQEVGSHGWAMKHCGDKTLSDTWETESSVFGRLECVSYCYEKNGLKCFIDLTGNDLRDYLHLLKQFDHKAPPDS